MLRQASRARAAEAQPIMQKRNFMKLEHLDFITFCVGSLASALASCVGWSASRVYGTLRSTGLLAGYIIPCYDVLHTFSKEYMVEDLTQALREKGALA